jgi:uncharacterized alkaline shock family protein YloU
MHPKGALPMGEKSRGAINIANDVLADIAGYAALESYGIVGMAAPTKADGVAQLLPRQKLRKGVKVASSGDGVEADLYVVVEHGTNIAEVSHNLARLVTHTLKEMADVPVARVDVHVMDVKVRGVK